MTHNKQHFTPVLANKRWASKEGQFTSYYRDERARRVAPRSRGKHQWGRQKRLWPREVEIVLNQELEDPVAPIYDALILGKPPPGSDRTKWAQFLLSQAVRTPTFLRYERSGRKLAGLVGSPSHDRVGCEHCGDLVLVTARRWCLLVAHEDDFFVRTDNPVHLTGFIERAETSIYYPLAPHICFVACPLVEGELIAPRSQSSIPAWSLPKGGAWMVNFYLAKHADESIILRPDRDGTLPSTMFGEILGVYPQPPFPFHAPRPEELADAFESVRSLQSVTDGRDYPTWSARDLESTGAIYLAKLLALEADCSKGAEGTSG